MRKNHTSKILAVGIVVLFIGVSIVPAQSDFSLINEFNHFSNNSRRTIYVDDDNTEGPWKGTQFYPYQFIQDAINSTNEGDAVYVYSGIYYEYVKISNKNNIHLIGEEIDSTILDGSKSSGIWSGINIFANKVTVEGFTIQYYCGIHGGLNVWNDNNRIYRNIVKNNLMGIDVIGNNNLIIRNSIINNGEEGIVSGMYVYGFKNAIIGNNFINNQRRRFQVTFEYDEKPHSNFWFGNYWDNWPGIIPKPILGDIRIRRPYPRGDLFIPWLNIDWFPVLRPYVI